MNSSVIQILLSKILARFMTAGRDTTKPYGSNAAPNRLNSLNHMQYRLTSSPRGRLDNLCSPAILLIDIERHYFFKEATMFDIKGIRTFATSAKDLDKAVEFYTKVIGGQIVKKVEPTRGTDKSRAGQRSRRAPRQLRSASLRCVDQAARSRSASHAEYSLAGTRKGSYRG